MATVQIQSSSATPKATPRPWPQQLVETRQSWSDPWATRLGDFDNAYLQCLQCTQSAAPTMPRAVFRYLSGNIKREDATSFAEESARDFRDFFVRVSFIPARDPDSRSKPGNANSSGPQVLWVGRFGDQQTEWLGGDTTTLFPASDQDIIAFGIEAELAKTPITGAWADDGNGHLIHLATPMIFNERYKIGLSPLGNRGKNLVTSPLNGIKAYPFARDGEPWSVFNILAYLCAFHPPAGNIPIDLSAPPADPNRDALNSLRQVILPRVSLDGLNVYQAIDKLIPRRRGMNWSLRPDSSGDRLSMRVSTTFDHDVNVAGPGGDERIPGNKDIIRLSLTDKIEPESVRFCQDTTNNYGTIIVEGEPVISCFTVGFTGNSLEKNWKDADQTTYLAGAGKGDGETGAADANDQARQDPKLQHVFQTFRIPKAWDWTVSADGSARTIANPAIKKDGTLDAGSAAPATVWGNTFLPHLPLRRTQARDADDDGGAPEFEKPFVVVQAANGKWILGHAWDQAARRIGNLRMLDSELGFELKANPPHAMAANHWSGANPSKFNPSLSLDAVDYQSMFATVAVKTNEVLRVTVTIPGRDPDRTLRLRVRAAELWYIVPGTITGVDSSGKLVRRTGGSTTSTTPDPDKDQVVRNDGQRLRRVAAMAKAWYGKQRAAITAEMQDFQLDYHVGAYVSTANDSRVEIDLNSLITSVTWSFQNATTTVMTDFGEMDFAGLIDLPTSEG